MGRSIGVDLHRDCFTTAILAENGRCYTREWQLRDLDKFVGNLWFDDRIAVEMTTNVRMFHDAVAPHVERVDVVNTRQFKVVTESVKKTDKNDAVLLARFLDKDMLPTVHLKSKAMAELASLTRTRDTLVKQRTALKNQVNNLFAASGVTLRRERMSSQKALSEVEREASGLMPVAEALGALTAPVKITPRRNQNSLHLQWPISGAGLELAASDSLTEPVWNNATNVIETTGSLFQTTVPLDGDARFFRLQPN